MPKRSLNSSKLKWPDATTVVAALHAWAEQTTSANPNLVAVGYFGSYSTGNWGVGSDLDVILVVENASEPFERRGAAWDLTSLPVPCDLLVYTESEYDVVAARGDRFANVLTSNVKWVFSRRLLP